MEERSSYFDMEECFVDDVEEFISAIMAGKFVVGCKKLKDDIEFLKVYHYTKFEKTERIEIFSIYNHMELKFEDFIIKLSGFPDGKLRMTLKDIAKEYDRFFIDKHGMFNLHRIHNKSGELIPFYYGTEKQSKENMVISNGFKLTNDCFSDDINVLFDELLKGRYLIGCFVEDGEVTYGEVFHYTNDKETPESYDIYEIISEGDIHKLMVQYVVTTTDGVPKDMLRDLLKCTLEQYDFFYIDKYECLDTKKIYKKSDMTFFVI